MKFTKPPLSIDAQIHKLRSRGLVIKNDEFARSCLSRFSYYRLSGYWWSFQSDKINHLFKPNSKFETVVNLYYFDSELRALLFDAIEKIEISLRCKLTYHVSQEFDAWWFEDPNNFMDVSEHTNSLRLIGKELSRTKEDFIKKHKLKYFSDTRMPPSWKTLEVVSMGTLSRLYGNLKLSCKSKNHIANSFSLPNHTYLHSWFQSISLIRNICAHHGRLWNKRLTDPPKLPPKPKEAWIKKMPKGREYHSLYIRLCCIKYLLNTTIPSNNFTYRLYSLLKKYPNIDIRALGMPEGWYNEPLWNHKLDT